MTIVQAYNSITSQTRGEESSQVGRSRWSVHKRARVLWQDYKELCATFDSSFQSRLNRYFYEKCDFPFTISLSSFAPVSLCYALGVREESVVRSIGLANICLDHFAQVLDDCTDEGYSTPEDLHLSHKLLITGISYYRDCLNGNEQAMREIECNIERVMAAERSLWRCKRGGKFGVENLRELADRGMMANCMVIALKHITDCNDSTAGFSEALAAAAVGIQLCDDVLDWEADLKEGTMTWPLTIGGLGHLEKRTDIDKASASAQLLSSRALESILREGVIELIYASEKFESLQCKDLADLLFKLARSGESAETKIRALRKKSEEYTAGDSINVYEHLRCILEDCDLRLQH